MLAAAGAIFRLSSRSFAGGLNRLFRQIVAEEFEGVGAKGPRDCYEFHDVNPPLVTFIFGDEGLRPPELFGQCLLANPGLLSHCDKNIYEAAIFRGFQGFLH